MEALFLNRNISGFFIKAFAVILSFIYLIYAIVLRRQVVVMTRSLKTGRSSLILLVSLLQIFVAIFLIILAFALL